MNSSWEFWGDKLEVTLWLQKVMAYFGKSETLADRIGMGEIRRWVGSDPTPQRSAALPLCRGGPLPPQLDFLPLLLPSPREIVVRWGTSLLKETRWRWPRAGGNY